MTSKITSLARTISLLAAVAGLALLIWDAIKGCNCHCSWIFALFLLATIILFVIWVRDMIVSDTLENKRQNDEVSQSGGYVKPSAETVKEEKPSAKVTEAPASPKKVELSEEEVAAKMEILRNAIGEATGQDDLKKISGIGPVYEEKLHSMGIKTFEQLSKLTPEAIEAVEQLTNFPGRVEREDWIGQAKKLMEQ